MIHMNGHWGDDVPAAGPDTTADDERARKAGGDHTFKLVGSYCLWCSGEDNKHAPGCGRNN
jgi:hypothetical protein